ncbi:MAG: thermonuclease family protein [Clostridia bacterium]|nr:thermonuclease family protein [Clostridia bacterium]
MNNTKFLRILRAGLAALLALTMAVSLLLASGCHVDKNGKDPSGGTPEADIIGEWEYERDASLPDFATMVTLKTSDIEADFDKTGRGLVTVEQFIDGDTVHFWNNSHTEIIKVRFVGIDTPESTGKVEPWGHPASIYTKTRLQNASQIVLESNEEGTPTVDSTGDRYLAWVWYKPSGSDTWRNLNIEILSDGLAMGKSTSSTRYGDVAMEALTSARTERINLYSGKRDPLFYYGETIDLTIKALVMNRSAYSSLKVRFEGVVTKESGGGIYMEEFDEDTQQYYGVYVYGGYAPLAPKFLVPGYRLSVTGTADDNENFGFQVSGLSFSLINPTDDDTRIIEKDVEFHPTLITANDLLTNDTLENTFVRLENLTVTSVYTTKNNGATASDGAMTLTCKSADGKTVTVRTVKLTLDGETVTEDYFMGKTMNVQGIFTFYQGSPQLKLFTLADVEILQ